MTRRVRWSCPPSHHHASLSVRDAHSCVWWANMQHGGGVVVLRQGTPRVSTAAVSNKMSQGALSGRQPIMVVLDDAIHIIASTAS